MKKNPKIYKDVFLNTYWIIALFPICTPMQSLCQLRTRENSIQHLNLDFEKLNKDNLPINIKWKSAGGKYKVSIDSIDKANGKYSLKLQSVKVAHKKYHRPFAAVYFYLQGQYLKNKEILITAYLKPNLTRSAFADLWYNKNPDFDMQFSGGMHLTGKSNWRKYRLVFYTDSSTQRISFGAGLFGEGSVNIDHFAIYINGHLADSSFVKDNGLKNSSKTNHPILIHHTSGERLVMSNFNKGDDLTASNTYNLKNNIEAIDNEQTSANTRDHDQQSNVQDPYRPIESHRQLLNFGFEKLNKNKLPANVKWQSKSGKYKISVDSTVKVEGRYSLKLQSVKVPGTGTSFIDVIYQLKGNYLRNKEILITAYLMLKGVRPAFTGLWYNTYPSPIRDGVDRVFYGDMNLTGTSDWKKYKLIFYTDSTTKSVSFGAYLFGKGKVNVDHFAVYMNGQPLDSAEMKKDLIDDNR